MGKCCCGRVKDCTEPVQIGNVRHEPIGADRFCGPADKHMIRDLRTEVDRLEKENAQLRDESLAGGCVAKCSIVQDLRTRVHNQRRELERAALIMKQIKGAP